MANIIAVDTAYLKDKAITAGVLIHSWDDAEPVFQFCDYSPVISEYIPGQFYKREMPLLSKTLRFANSYPFIIIRKNDPKFV